MTAITFPNSPSSGDTHTAGNGIVYTYDGEKWTSIGTNSAGTWTRSGTEVSLTNAGDDLNVDSGTLFVDASTDRVGIGTASPSETLEVNSGAGNTPLKLVSTDSAAYIQIEDDATTAANRIGAIGNDIVLHTDGSEKARLDSSGRLGVGTSSPLRSLHVAGAGDTGLMLQTTNAVDDKEIWEIQVAGDASNHANLIFRSRTNAGTGGTEALRITNDGKVGIGTTSPNRLLTANGIVGVQASGTEYLRLYGQGGSAVIDSVSSKDLILDAGGASNSLVFYQGGGEAARIDSSKRLLVGTSSSSSNTIAVFQGYAGGSTGPGIVYLQRGQTAPTANAEIGQLFFANSSGNLGAGISAVADANWTAGSSHPTRLVFSTTADGASSPTNRMTIYSNGTTVFQNGNGVQVYGTDNNANIGVLYVRNDNTTADNAVVAFATATNSTATSNVLVKFGINLYGSGSGQINANGSGQAAFGFFSDERLKENITDLPSQWQNIKNLRPVEFDFIESQGGEHQIGFIAQEFQTVYPDAVGSQRMFNGVDEESGEERLTLTDWSKTDTRLVKALQEAMERIETLEAEVAALKAS